MAQSNAKLFIGRLSRDIRNSDLEDIFSVYGKINRCDIKPGPESNYAFIDFDDKRDAEDALKYEDGREILGRKCVVEWSKGFRIRDGFVNDRDRYSGAGRARYDDRDDYRPRRRPTPPRRPRSRSRSRERRRSSRSRSRDRVPRRGGRGSKSPSPRNRRRSSRSRSRNTSPSQRKRKDSNRGKSRSRSLSADRKKSAKDSDSN